MFNQWDAVQYQPWGGSEKPEHLPNSLGIAGCSWPRLRLHRIQNLPVVARNAIGGPVACPIQIRLDRQWPLQLFHRQSSTTVPKASDRGVKTSSAPPKSRTLRGRGVPVRAKRGARLPAGAWRRTQSVSLVRAELSRGELLGDSAPPPRLLHRLVRSSVQLLSTRQWGVVAGTHKKWPRILTCTIAVLAALCSMVEHHAHQPFSFL